MDTQGITEDTMGGITQGTTEAMMEAAEEERADVEEAGEAEEAAEPDIQRHLGV